MRKIVTALVAALLCVGCASTTLKQYTLNQSLSVTDMRYRQVLDDLATVAHNAGTLPAFALTAGGIANVTNTVSIDTATIWDQAVKGFSKETLAAFGQHNPELQWTLDPVVSEPQLEGLYWACFWALHGPPPEGSRAMELLREPRITDITGCALPGAAPPRQSYHLNVARQLAAIRPGWLHVTPNDCVPRHVAYKATRGDTTVWVTPDGLAGLSEFTLVMLDIATIDPTSLAIPRPTVSVVVQAKKNAVHLPPNLVNGTGKEGDSNKTTETWDACQEVRGTAAGKIKLSRPVAIRQPISQLPEIEYEQFTPGVTPVTPKLYNSREASSSLNSSSK
jgi:hypothetical protein